MSFTIQVRMKRIGKQKKEDLRPVPFVLERKPETVKELLVLLTRLLVQEYNARKDEGQLVKYLTREEIKEKASAGKVSFGLRGGWGPGGRGGERPPMFRGRDLPGVLRGRGA